MPIHANSQDREQRLNEVFAAYLESAEHDPPPDRGAWLARYPEFAAELADFFAARDAVSQYTAAACASVLSRLPLDQGDSFGDYELLEVLAHGGMGVVYRARQKSLDRVVALKMLLAGQWASPAERRRFQAEAEAVAALDHPGIVPLYEVGEWQPPDGKPPVPYFTMKLIEGGSLTAHLDAFRTQPRETAKLVAALAHAVHHAHQRGVLHRDLKPSNILLASGVASAPRVSVTRGADATPLAYVSDFGLAKRLGTDPSLTHSGTLIGTPGYMAPEQASGRKDAVTTAADVYGLGAVLYALLTGRPPFAGDSALETLEQVKHSEPAAPRQHNPVVAADLETICQKCLAKEPARRYPSAEALAEDLERWLSGEPIQARPVGRVGRITRWCRRNPHLAGAMGLVVALLLVILTGLPVALWRITQAYNVAESHRQQATLQAAEYRRLAYPGGIRQAYLAWKNHNVQLARETLAQFAPTRSNGDLYRSTDNAEDLRSFEWHYLWRLCHGGRRVLDGHVGAVYHASFSPDGTCLATAGQDRTIRLWAADSGVQLAELRGHTDEVNWASFSPDGKRLVSASDDKTARLWDVVGRQQLHVFEGVGAPVVAAVFSPDGRWVATGDRRGNLRVWDADTFTERLPRLKGHEGAVQSMAFSPDGRTLATGSDDRTAALWDLNGTGEPRVCCRHSNVVYAVAFSRTGNRLATGGKDPFVRIWDTSTGAEQAALPGATGAIQSVSFGSDDRTVSATSDDSTAYQWDLATGTLHRVFHSHVHRCFCVAYSPDGETLASASVDGTVRLWDANSDQEQHTLPALAADVMGLALAPDQRTLWTGETSGTVRQWDLTTRRLVATLTADPRTLHALALSTDGDRLATTGTTGKLSLWDARTRTHLRSHPLPPEFAANGARPVILAFSRDGGSLLLGPAADCLWLLDPDTGAQQACVRPAIGAVVSGAISSDGTLVGAGNFLDGAALLDARTGQVRQRLDGHRDSVCAVGFSPDGRWFATAGNDRRIMLWEQGTTLPPRALLGHVGVIAHLAFSPNGKTLASAGHDNTVRLWHVATGQELLTLGSRKTVFNRVAFSGDGRRLVAGGWDLNGGGGRVVIWDTAGWD